jgi:hypothetical protein
VEKATFNGFWPGICLFGTLLLSACSGAGGPQDQVLPNLAIAYIKRPIPIQPASNPPVPVDPDVREPTAFNAGGDLYIRDNASPSAPEQNITACITGGTGDVKDLSASPDGTKLIFSLRLEDPNPGDNVVPTWNIYEYGLAKGGCPHRVITDDNTAEEGDDLGPAYLPDGRIVFTSSRQKLTGAIQLDEGNSQFTYVDENLREHALNLHVMYGGGSNIQQITFNQSDDLDPSVLSSGEIVFSRWDHMGNSNSINLYKVRPDGTGLKLLYGAHGHDIGTGGSAVQFLSPQELDDGRIMSMMKPFNGSAGGGMPVILDVAHYADINQPTWPYQGILSGKGQVNAVSIGVTTDGSISPDGRFRSFYPLRDGSNRALVSWTQCRLQPVDSMGVPLPEPPVPCPSTIPPNAVEAMPIYGIYIYDMTNDTQLPVVIPQEGFIFDEPIVIASRTEPQVLFDKTPGFGLDQTLSDEHVGLLHIRSVYDFDGKFNNLGATNNMGSPVTSLAMMADPTQTDADHRPARFLRLIKGAYIPDSTVQNLDPAAFGASRRQGMREILGYAPIEPDGSVLVKVPANVPFAISIVDKDGRRIGGRHQNWLQLKPGQVLECNGCHDHNPTAPAQPLPHGYTDAPPALNSGAPTSGLPFAGTTTDIDPVTSGLQEIIPEMGETMAQARIRSVCPDGSGGIDYTAFTCPQLSPAIDLEFTDVWANGAIPDVTDQHYADLTTPLPASATNTHCQPWDASCRTIINYEQQIHPIWSVDRGTRTCTNCHTNAGVVPAAQLDLTDGPSDQEPKQFKSYRELLFPDNEVDANGQDVLVDQVVQQTDANGNLVFDVNGNPVLITVQMPVPAQGPSMSVQGSRAGTFMSKFLPAGSHAGDLSPAELRLIAEWLDIGAQYYNDPFDPSVPLN